MGLSKKNVWIAPSTILRQPRKTYLSRAHLNNYGAGLNNATFALESDPS